MERWLSDYIEIELNKSRPKSILDKILEEGYTKVDIDLRHFDVYEKGDKRILYSPIRKEIDTVYNAGKVFERIRENINFKEDK